MKIYHYTSIDTLALIIRHKAIRFNRLDNVDDYEESCYGSGSANIKLGQYQFVSCWTKDAQENISLWKMYTNNKGVRIGLDEDMFVTYAINDSFKSYFQQPIDIKGNCMITPIQNEAKLYNVIYVDDPQAEIKKLVESKESYAISYNTKDAGLYKRKEWKFQNESRFKISVFPINPDMVKAPKEMTPFNSIWAMMESLYPSIQTNSPININHFDISLKEDSLRSIEVMLGPMTTDGDRILVEALLREYNDAKILDSYFKGKIRK